MSRTNTIGTHKTSVFTEAGTTKVIYHDTAVVSFNSDTITLNTGGYFTRTTKLRMNQASNQFDLGFKVYQRQGTWYVDYLGDITPLNAGGCIEIPRHLKGNRKY